MKSFIIVLLALECCLLGVTNGQTEKDPCDLRCHERKEYKPICGNNGDGKYQRFANSCYLSMANCKNPNTYTVVSLHLCDKTTAPPTPIPTSATTTSPQTTEKPTSTIPAVNATSVVKS